MCCGDSIASLNGYLNTNFKFFNNAIGGKWAVRNSLPPICSLITIVFCQ